MAKTMEIVIGRVLAPVVLNVAETAALGGKHTIIGMSIN